jgi:hypothetical protein
VRASSQNLEASSKLLRTRWRLGARLDLAIAASSRTTMEMISLSIVASSSKSIIMCKWKEDLQGKAIRRPGLLRSYARDDRGRNGKGNGKQAIVTL